MTRTQRNHQDITRKVMTSCHTLPGSHTTLEVRGYQAPESSKPPCMTCFSNARVCKYMLAPHIRSYTHPGYSSQRKIEKKSSGGAIILWRIHVTSSISQPVTMSQSHSRPPDSEVVGPALVQNIGQLLAVLHPNPCLAARVLLFKESRLLSIVVFFVQLGSWSRPGGGGGSSGEGC